MRRDPGERKLDHAAQRELGLAMLARAPRIRDRHQREAEPAHQPAQEDVLVLQAVHHVHHGAVEQHVVGAARLDAHVADRIEHAVIKLRGEPLGRRHAVIVAPRRDDLRAPLPGRDQFRDQLGRMLEIRIHHDHAAPARMAQARAQRGLMAEIARERHVADGGIARRRADRRERAVGRAVVDEDDLVGALQRHRLRDRGRDGRDVAGLVMGRQHDRDFGPRRPHE